MSVFDVTCPHCCTLAISPWANFRATVRRPATCPNCSKQFYRRHYVYGAVKTVVITLLLIGLFIVYLAYAGIAVVAAGIGTGVLLTGIWVLEVKTARLKEFTDVQKNDADLITLICKILLYAGVLALTGMLAYEIYTYQ